MDARAMCGQAARYRAIARTITDIRTIKALNDLADEYEMQAANADADKISEAKTGFVPFDRAK